MPNPSLGNKVLSERIDFLGESPLFSRLRAEDLEEIAKSFYPRPYKKKQIIFHQGDDSRVLYIVMKGKVRIYTIDQAGSETSIHIFSERGMIGEFAAIDGQPRSATAQAIVDSVLLEMKQNDFHRYLREIPDLSVGMIHLLVDKLRWTTAFAESMAQSDAAGRLIQLFLQYTEKFGKELEAGRRYELDLATSQAGLASMVGARREWINRILRDWSQRGLIEYQRGKITILDLPAVEEEQYRGTGL
jgi:CRP-like cAMP-binding protein